MSETLHPSSLSDAEVSNQLCEKHMHFPRQSSSDINQPSWHEHMRSSRNPPQKFHFKLRAMQCQLGLFLGYDQRKHLRVPSFVESGCLVVVGYPNNVVFTCSEQCNVNWNCSLDKTGGSTSYMCRLLLKVVPWVLLDLCSNCCGKVNPDFGGDLNQLCDTNWTTQVWPYGTYTNWAQIDLNLNLIS